MSAERPASDAVPAFPLATGRVQGYHRAAVDAFLSGARARFGRSDGALTAAQVREASFPLAKRGYDVAAVDRALARLEDACAERERQRAIDTAGAEVWVRDARAKAQEVLDHLSRPPRQRFARTGRLTYGYRVEEVDFVADRIARYLRDGEAITVEQVRTAAFRMQRHGYREEQVDALLDATIEIILAVR